MTPRLNCASVSPWAAAKRYHFRASVGSGGTPSPLVYMTPRLNCALATPWAAAKRYHFRASVGSGGTPSPLVYMTPRLNCALATPWAAYSFSRATETAGSSEDSAAHEEVEDKNKNITTMRNCLVFIASLGLVHLK